MSIDKIPDDEIVAVREHLKELADNDRDELAELTGLLVESLRRTQDGLAAAVQAGGRAGIVERAHALCGAALMAKLTTIAAGAGRIEHGEAPAGAIPGEVTRLAALVDQAIAAVRTFC